ELPEQQVARDTGLAAVVVVAHLRADPGARQVGLADPGGAERAGAAGVDAQVAAERPLVAGLDHDVDRIPGPGRGHDLGAADEGKRAEDALALGQPADVAGVAFLEAQLAADRPGAGLPAEGLAEVLDQRGERRVLDAEQRRSLDDDPADRM